MTEPHEQVEHVTLVRRQSLCATVIRACGNCGAPGFWHDRQDLPFECYDPFKKQAAEARGEGFAPVGRFCPRCGAWRTKNERLGEIWSKVWRAPTLWEMIKGAITRWRTI